MYYIYDMGIPLLIWDRCIMSLSPSDSVAQGKDFEVAIVGGGICGLACALTLANQGVTVQIYEAAVCDVHCHIRTELSGVIQSAFGEIGAGIGIGTSDRLCFDLR